MADIVILGAGLTGLSTAFHLEQLGYYDYTVFEKDSSVGGLCRSVVSDGFTFDYTGHLLHINDPYFTQFIDRIVGFDNLIPVNRRSFVYSHNTYTAYPYQINLFGLPPAVVAECITKFVNRPRTKYKNPSFYQWVMANFGSGLGKHFFFPYQTKIFDFDIQQLSASWTGRFVPPTSLQDMVLGALQPPTNHVGYNAQFYYPRTDGIQFWIDKMHAQLQNKVRTNHTVTHIDIRDKRVHFANGHSEPYNTLISTLPLDILLGQLRHETASNLASARTKLRCNSVINFNIGVNRPDLSDKHWIYYPEAQYPFYRIGFPHNFTQAAVPAGCSSLYGEFSALGKSQSHIDETLAASLVAAKKLLHITDDEIVAQKIITIPHAYVIFDRWRDRNIEKLHSRLHEYDIHSIGRYGAWKYSSMQEGVLDGKAMAQELLRSRQYMPARSCIEETICAHEFHVKPSHKDMHETK